MTMLTELESRNRRAALESFVRAVFKGREPESLLSLSSAAGLSGSEADQLAARINQARRQLAQANQLPRLRKDAAAAQERLDKAQAKATAENTRLEAQVEEASYLANHARKAVYAAEDCARQLLALHDEGLLLAETPAEVAHLVERRTAEAKVHAAHQALNAATDERNRRRAVVEDIEHRLTHMPILPPLDQQRHENLLRDALKEAKAELAKAESQFRKAQAALESARRAVPASL